MIEAVESNDESCWSRELEVSELERELLEQGGGGNGTFVRRNRSGRWEGTNLLYEGSGVGDGRKMGVCAEETERRMGGNESFVQRKRSEVWEEDGRLCGGNGTEDGR